MSATTTTTTETPRAEFLAAFRRCREAIARRGRLIHRALPIGAPVAGENGRTGVIAAHGYGADGELVKVETGPAAFQLVKADRLLALNPHLGREPS